MKRHDHLAPLSRTHHRVLVLSQVLKTNVPAYKGMPTEPREKVAFLHQSLENYLQPHMRLEEQELFPTVKGFYPKIDQLVEELKQEHRELEALIAQLDTTPDLEAALHEIGELLAIHVRKEERQLFELVQKHLPEDILTSLSL